MKASEIVPPMLERIGHTASLKLRMLLRKWYENRRNVEAFEHTMLELLSNPATTPDQMVMVSGLYADITKRMHEAAVTVNEHLIGERTPKVEPDPEPEPPCFFCGCTEPTVKPTNGDWPYCPNCKGV